METVWVHMQGLWRTYTAQSQCQRVEKKCKVPIRTSKITSLAWCLWPWLSVAQEAKVGVWWGEGLAGLECVLGQARHIGDATSEKGKRVIPSGVRLRLNSYCLMPSDPEHLFLVYWPFVLENCLLISFSHSLFGSFDALLLKFWILCTVFILNFHYTHTSKDFLLLPRLHLHLTACLAVHRIFFNVINFIILKKNLCK